MRYETQEDRENQAIMKAHVENYLIKINGWPVSVKETSLAKAESHDFELIDEQGYSRGVVEVKCRKGRYTEEFFERNGWLIDMPRIEYMRNAWASIGAFAMFGLLTSDKVPYVISFQKLESILPTLRAAESHMLKDDHGRRPTQKTGVIVPLNEMTRIP